MNDAMVSDCCGERIEERPTQVVMGYLDGSKAWTETRYIMMCSKCDEECTPIKKEQKSASK